MFVAGRAWAAATTEGLLLYSLNPSMAFTPYDLEMETTVEKALEYLSQKELGKALVCSLRLNEDDLIQRVIESVLPDDSKLNSFSNKSSIIICSIFCSQHIEMRILVYVLLYLLASHGAFSAIGYNGYYYS